MKTKVFFLMGMIALSIPTVSISASNSEKGVCSMADMRGDGTNLSYRRILYQSMVPYKAWFILIPILWWKILMVMASIIGV